MKSKKPKGGITEDLLNENTPDGRKKLAISRIFLIIFMVMFVLTLGYTLILGHGKPSMSIEIQDYIDLLETKLDAVKVVLQALEWIIGLLLVYALGSKGFHWAAPMMGRPIDQNQNENYSEDGDYTNIVINRDKDKDKENIKPKGDGSMDNPASIKDFN